MELRINRIKNRIKNIKNRHPSSTTLNRKDSLASIHINHRKSSKTIKSKGITFNKKENKTITRRKNNPRPKTENKLRFFRNRKSIRKTN